MASRVYTGSCHCGAVGWEFETDADPAKWPVRACQCSFCRRHDARCTSDPAGRAVIRGGDSGHLVRYRFGLGVADFLVCGRCGVYLGAMVETDQGTFATLNLRALESRVPGLPEAEPVSYEGESGEDRVARRIARWTPVTLRA